VHSPSSLSLSLSLYIYIYIYIYISLPRRSIPFLLLGFCNAVDTHDHSKELDDDEMWRRRRRRVIAIFPSFALVKYFLRRLARMAPILRLQEIQGRVEEREDGEGERKKEVCVERRKGGGRTKKKERVRFAKRVGRTEQTDRSLIYGDHTSDI